MEPEVFKKKLNKKLPKSDDLSVKSKRAFLIAIYWTGLRSSELYERVFDDFEITETKLIIHLLRKKKKVHEDDEPISIRRDFPLVEEVVEWLQSQEWRTKVPARDKYNRIIRVNERRHFVVNDRPWNICRQTAQNYVDEVFAGYYPHYFRYNFVTNTTKVPSMKVSELRAKTHLSLAALENYVFTPEGEEDELDRRKAEQMKAKGVM
jgi:site-specific recombinase XerD